eukprot:TRINITY_DN4195_c0_g1_i1.p1 TRINITY_DN4195_c0_g1~~TRINITY_DN4195_c0_g1_i1.p1  ORF type:complete len:211 (+),score=43.07 TRINITY_DN4195_c0_g1_i1:542-1174(+)
MISGSAYKLSNNRALHHGTLLINVDMNALQNYLNPNKLKLQSKGVDSVRQRVANLQDINPTITHESLCDALMTEFFKFYGDRCPVEVLSREELKTHKLLRDTYEQQTDWNWRFGETPDFNHNLEHKFDWGLMDLYIDSKDGRIVDAKIYSDVLYPALVDVVRNCLVDARYDRLGVATALNQARDKLEADEENRPAAKYVEELRDWLVEAI